MAKDSDLEFVELLTASQEALRGYCYSKIRIWADAEDVLQAINVKLWEKLPEWDRSRAFLPWALGIARYTILSYYRDKGRDRLVFDEDIMEIMEEHLQESASETPEMILALQICIKKMAPEKREILRAHYVIGWSMVELAESTGKSVSAVKSVLMRLRSSLAKCVRRERLKLEEGTSDHGIA